MAHRTVCIYCVKARPIEMFEGGYGKKARCSQPFSEASILSLLTCSDFLASLGFLSPGSLGDSALESFLHRHVLFTNGLMSFPALLPLLPLPHHPVSQKSVGNSQALMPFLQFYLCYCGLTHVLYFPYHFNGVLGGRERGPKNLSSVHVDLEGSEDSSVL